MKNYDLKQQIKNKIKSKLKPLLPKSWIGHIRTFTLKQRNQHFFQPISKYSYADKESVKIIFTSGTAPKYNGGIKLYNLWVKLLRKQGFDSYIATIDGNYEKWLVEHQPVISYADVNRFRSKGYEVRIVTGWLDVPNFDEILKGEQFYYFDAELKWTLHYRKKLDYFLKKGMIAGIATHSRYIQSWYMANYGIRPVLINLWSDPKVFYGDPKMRIRGRIGCMVETQEDEKIYNFLLQRCNKFNLCKDLIKIGGHGEYSVPDAMRTVDIFVGLNQGKHSLWGEGCPMTQQEAMHSGCVLVAFDCLGNREYLYNDWTGLMVQSGNEEDLWDSIKFLLENKNEKERLRVNGMNLIKSLFSERGKFELISSFLNLNGTIKDELGFIFPQPIWLHEREVPFLAKCASCARGIICEIGCAYGGSTTVFLLNKKKGVLLYSIDPFIKDSKGDFRASEHACRCAVREALKKKKHTDALQDWILIKRSSHDVVKTWNKEIDLLFIDGSHHYEDVKRDFYQWSRFLSPKGKILLHDSRKDNLREDPSDKVFSRGWSGPTRLVEELKTSSEFEVVDTCHSITVLMRKHKDIKSKDSKFAEPCDRDER